jgi:hypothetical protein
MADKDFRNLGILPSGKCGNAYVVIDDSIAPIFLACNRFGAAQRQASPALSGEAAKVRKRAR